MLKIIKNITKKIDYFGFEKLQYQGRTVFIANHVSLDDVIELDSLLPKEVMFAIDSDNQKHYTDLLKKRNHIIYDMFNVKSLTSIKKEIESNKPILIFPETKISNNGSFMKVYDEISDILLKTNPTIYPIYILGTENENFYPNQNVTIALDEPFTLNINENLNADKQRKNASTQILKTFQRGRFKHIKKSNVNLFNTLLETSKIIGEKTPIVEDMNSKMTYKDFLLATYAFSHKLKKTTEGKERIGTLLPTSIGYNITLFALFNLGKTPALLNFTMGEQNISDCVETSEIETIISSKEFIKKANLESVVSLLEKKANIIYLEDIKEELTQNDKLKALSDYTLSKKSSSAVNEIILFTSGSENKPKGVILTHDNIYSNIHQAMSTISLTKHDKILNFLPMFHSFGLTAGALLPILCGIEVFFYPSPLHYKMVSELSYRKDVTVLFGTSTFFSMYGKNAHPYDFNNIKLAIAGAEKLKPEVFDLWSEKFGIRIMEGYGVTEASPVLSLNTPVLNKKGTVGHLLPDIEYKIEPVDGITEGGNLLVKGDNIMKGYLIHGKGFIPRDDWYETGDIVSVDDEGFLKIISRLKRFAKIGGEMISLNLIEELAKHYFPESEFAVTSVPDKKKGEKIILITTNESIKLKEFKRFLKLDKHSSLLFPKDIMIIEEIPLLGSGKVDYVSVKKIAEEYN